MQRVVARARLCALPVTAALLSACVTLQRPLWRSRPLRPGCLPATVRRRWRIDAVALGSVQLLLVCISAHGLAVAAEFHKRPRGAGLDRFFREPRRRAMFLSELIRRDSACTSARGGNSVPARCVASGPRGPAHCVARVGDGSGAASGCHVHCSGARWQSTAKT